MVLIGYHSSHEQFPPSRLLQLVQRAEKAGFTAAMCSDHFAPWSERQGQSGYAWSWLGAAMQATAVPFGVVCAPGQRYHPAIVAQKAATLEEMFPGRFWMAVGSGQFVNEVVTGQGWPSKRVRDQRLRESAEIIKRMWAGETVDHHGAVTAEEGKLYTRPARPPMLVGAALSEPTASFVGSWADAMITTSRPPEQLREVIRAFREGGGKGKPVFLKVQLSYARDERAAEEGAWSQWAPVLLPHDLTTDLRTPRQFDRAASVLDPRALREGVRVSSDLEEHLRWLKDDISEGVDRIYLHNVNLEHDAFIEDFGKRVLPFLGS
ncbi:TIGR03885 family FMN-dependent LLM class oxidoreductase [Methanomassiliicoccus luminyensis]|uniref:TIGR03885 family FMN-dependent LLM class oxidoreductase n=1 Tax=Methanomassiliicoccus luminyensis TaxID=1080712 RepID=UPI0004749034|nr:TIGR03885 family FMN-dependent LLM class oxidoreductase [Methanomassiliicoccus luminyensis]